MWKIQGFQSSPTFSDSLNQERSFASLVAVFSYPHHAFNTHNHLHERGTTKKSYVSSQKAFMHFSFRLVDVFVAVNSSTPKKHSSSGRTYTHLIIVSRLARQQPRSSAQAKHTSYHHHHHSVVISHALILYPSYNTHTFLTISIMSGFQSSFVFFPDFYI